MTEILEKVERLREDLAYQEHRIFVLGSPTISPKDYWDMRDNLRLLETEHQLPVSSDSSSLRTPASRREEFESFPHAARGPQVPKLHYLSELKKYYQELEDHDGPGAVCVGTGRTSGPELEIFYADGSLERAILIQDGLPAIDVTDNARLVGSIPLKLRPVGSVTDTRVSKVVRQAMGPSTMSPVPKFSNDLVIRGILSMKNSDLNFLDRQRINSGQPPYLDSKAAVTASICALDPRVTAARRLHFFTHAVHTEIDGLETYWQLLSALKSWGFSVSPFMWRCEGLQEVLDFVSALQREKSKFAYSLDGGFLIVDRLFGPKRNTETAARAEFVFEETGQPAVVKSISQAVGRTGAILPIALLAAAEGTGSRGPDAAPIPAVSGTQLLSLSANDDVFLVDRPGGPPIIRKEQTANTLSSSRLDVCPSCSTKVEVYLDSPFVRCPNEKCSGRIRSRLLHLIGPEGLNLESLSIRVAEELFRGKKINLNYLISLTAADVDRVAPGKGAKVVEEIRRNKRYPLWKLLYLSDIDFMSERDARCLSCFARDLAGLERILKIQKPLESVSAISPEAHDGFVAWLKAGGINEFQELLRNGIEIIDDLSAPSALFRGRRIVIAGTLARVDQGSLIIELEKLGARIEHNVNRMTDLLVCGNGVSEHLDASEYYGTPTISEADLLPLILEYSGRS